MSVLEIRELGDPVLRGRAREVLVEELAGVEMQRLIDDMIETMRAANGAGLAAPQVGVGVRIVVIEVRPGNPRYPYKPPIPLTVIVNPELTPIDGVLFATNEGCFSMPNIRGDLKRFENVEVRYLDRYGSAHRETRRGLTAGTFQHEIDHHRTASRRRRRARPLNAGSFGRPGRWTRDALPFWQPRRRPRAVPSAAAGGRQVDSCCRGVRSGGTG